jgi:hypothetical protein
VIGFEQAFLITAAWLLVTGCVLAGLGDPGAPWVILAGFGMAVYLAL